MCNCYLVHLKISYKNDVNSDKRFKNTYNVIYNRCFIRLILRLVKQLNYLYIYILKKTSRISRWLPKIPDSSLLD